MFEHSRDIFEPANATERSFMLARFASDKMVTQLDTLTVHEWRSIGVAVPKGGCATHFAIDAEPLGHFNTL